jgi:hypothetical protein
MKRGRVTLPTEALAAAVGVVQMGDLTVGHVVIKARPVKRCAKPCGWPPGSCGARRAAAAKRRKR